MLKMQKKHHKKMLLQNPNFGHAHRLFWTSLSPHFLPMMESNVIKMMPKLAHLFFSREIAEWSVAQALPDSILA